MGGDEDGKEMRMRRRKGTGMRKRVTERVLYVITNIFTFSLVVSKYELIYSPSRWLFLSTN